MIIDMFFAASNFLSVFHFLSRFKTRKNLRKFLIYIYMILKLKYIH